MSKIKAVDIFKRPFYFLMPDEKEYYSTYLGTMFSILSILILLSYSGYKLRDLFIYNNYRLYEQNELHYFNDADAFTTADGFHVAAGLISDDGSLEDPEIGTLKFYIKSWDVFDPETNGELSFTEVKTRPCQANDFKNQYNLDTKFYSMHSSTQRVFDLYGDAVKCIDEESLSINGFYDASVTANLMIVFELCDSKVRLCKSQ